MPTDDRAIRPARPTVHVEGRQVAELTDGLHALRIHDRAEGMASCELEVGNWGLHQQSTTFLWFDRDVLDFGKAIELRLGDDVLFKGRITGLEGVFPDGAPPRLSVLGEDALQDLRMTRRTRTFADASDADVFRQLANDHGLTADVDVNGPTHKVLAQLGQSDLAFALERARAIGAEVHAGDRELKVHQSTGGSAVTLGLGRALRELTILADLAEQRTSLAVSGWDVQGKQALREQAGDNALGGELAGGQSGADALRTAFGERKETVAATVPVTGDEARARAEALFRRRARRFVAGHAVAETDAALKVGATVRLEGVGPLFSGDYVITEVTHRFDAAHGLRSELEVERPGMGRP